MLKIIVEDCVDLVFVHGWNVTNTDTYGQLPQVLEKLSDSDSKLSVHHIHLGRYISFDDEVRLDDIARAFDDARLSLLANKPFAAITHSTGAPVMRQWLQMFFSGSDIKTCPLTHLIMLAPANHGSALAQLGKSRVGRIKSFFAGVEPGEAVLDWLELGSTQQLQLNLDWLREFKLGEGPWPFVLTGETIDDKFYDYLNSYTGESGSDGVVRVAAANLNFTYVKLKESAESCNGFDARCVVKLSQSQYVTPQHKVAFEVIKKASHSGKEQGIMTSVTAKNTKSKPQVQRILQCLNTRNAEQYRQLSTLMATASESGHRKQFRGSMLVVRVSDDLGNPIEDFDIVLLSGADFLPSKFKKGFMLDKQKNIKNKHVVSFYLDAKKLAKVDNGQLGLRIEPRPDNGMCYYRSAEFHSEPKQISLLLQPDQTSIIDIVLTRQRHPNLFSLVNTESGGDFTALNIS
nr:alpha/beta hydrolase [Shewanella pneumatophori]